MSIELIKNGAIAVTTEGKEVVINLQHVIFMQLTNKDELTINLIEGTEYNIKDDDAYTITRFYKDFIRGNVECPTINRYRDKKEESSGNDASELFALLEEDKTNKKDLSAFANLL